MTPFYDYSAFKEACKKKMVIPINSTLDDACYFNLNTLEALMDFIVEDGFDDLRFFERDILYNSRDPVEKPVIDQYHFVSGQRANVIGYMAFFKYRTRDTWNLKSFHRDRGGFVTLVNNRIHLIGG